MAAANAMEDVEGAGGRVLVGGDLTMGEELDLGPPPPRVQLKEAGKRTPWGPVVEPAKEGPPLSPLGPGPLEVDGTWEALEDSAAVGEATNEENDSSLQLS